MKESRNGLRMSRNKILSLFVWSFTILSIVTYLALIVITISYKGFFLNKLGISSDFFLIACFFFGLGVMYFFIIQTTIKHCRWFKFFLNIVYRLTPAILFVYVLLLLIEGVNYQNYVLANLHINFAGFFNFLVLNIFLTLYYLLIIRKNFVLLKKICIILPLVAMAIIFLQTWSWYAFWLRTAEDGPVENLQVIFYFLSSVFSLLIALSIFGHNKKMAALYFLIGLGLFVVSIEEISWGQRIFNLQTPEIIKGVNDQGEINIHNLRPIQKVLHNTYILISLLGASLHWIIPKNLRASLWYRLIAPPKFLFTLFFLTFFYYMYITHVDLIIRTMFNFNLFVTNQWQEIAEFFLSLALMIFTAHLYYELKEKSVNKLPDLKITWL